jgi:hypothetical protein
MLGYRRRQGMPSNAGMRENEIPCSFTGITWPGFFMEMPAGRLSLVNLCETSFGTAPG